MSNERITIDHDVCYSSGECVLLEPTAFAIGGQGTAIVLAEAENLSSDMLATIVRSCPSGAISVLLE